MNRRPTEPTPPDGAARSSDDAKSAGRVTVTVAPARVDWLEALTAGDDVFMAHFGIHVEPGWVGFPDSLAPALAATRQHPNSPWGTHLIFDDRDGALVGFGGFKGAPANGEVEIGYAVAPARQGQGIATAAVAAFVEQARTAGVTTVSAHTLDAENPSTAVLRKSGFQHVASLPDNDLGLIWRWELTLPPDPTQHTTARTHQPNNDDTAVAIASIHAMAEGQLADFKPLYTTDAVNRESATEPPDTRGKGPTAFFATARWLRAAFDDLTWESTTLPTTATSSCSTRR